MDNHTPNMPSLREFLTFYYKNRGKLLLSFFLPFFLCVAASYIPAPLYTASSVLTVRMGSEYIYQPEVGSTQNTQTSSIPFEREEIFKAEVAILGSEDLHKEVIKQIGIDALYPKVEGDTDVTTDANLALAKAAMKFDKRFDVNLEKESSVITVSFENKDSEVAVKTLNLLLKLYLDKRKGLYQENREALAKTHAEEARQHVMSAENAVEKFKRDHNILSFDAEKQALITQRSDIQRQTASVSSVGLNEKLAYFEDKLNRLNRDEATFNALNHDVTIANDEYAVFVHRLNEASAYEDLQRARAGSVRVIQPPSAPAEPKKLQPLILAGGFVLSLLIALVTGILIDAFSSGFLTPEQLSKVTGIPVLVSLPRKKRRHG